MGEYCKATWQRVWAHYPIIQREKIEPFIHSSVVEKVQGLFTMVKSLYFILSEI